MATKDNEVPQGHIDDPDSVESVLESLRNIHGSSYRFSVDRWDGRERLEPRTDRIRYLFAIRAEEASVRLGEGNLIRGPSPDGPFRSTDGAYAEVTEDHTADVWPGDVLTVRDGDRPLDLTGRGVYFEVEAEETDYPAPRLSMLRNLESEPGGCASYDRAFRRETLPPHEGAEGSDERGTNRVNEHTLDMRVDRDPGPITHYHDTVSVSDGSVNHTETAIVLPRSTYDLPPFEGTGEGRVRMYRNPAEDPSDSRTVPVRPGSLLVTPATEEQVYGHRFENAFAMLIAIPGFVAPLNLIEE